MPCQHEWILQRSHNYCGSVSCEYSCRKCGKQKSVLHDYISYESYSKAGGGDPDDSHEFDRMWKFEKEKYGF